MAISFFQTASWMTIGTNAGSNLSYKDVVLTGVQTGDLIVVMATAADTAINTATRAIVTQAGATTGAWTTSLPASSVSADSDAIGGYALATSAGTVTVRVTLRVGATGSNYMGVGAWLIPAAEKGATYGWATNFSNNTIGNVSVTLSGSSTVLYAAGDWTAGTGYATVASTPVASNYRVRVSGSGTYSVYVADWLAQAAGTRNYGPNGLTAKDFTGAIFRMDTASGGSSFSGSVSLSGTGTLSATGNPSFSRSAALSGSGTLSSARTVGVSGSAALSGSGTLSASAKPAFSGAVNLTGTGNLTATGVPGTSETSGFPIWLKVGGSLVAYKATAVKVGGVVKPIVAGYVKQNGSLEPLG